MTRDCRGAAATERGTEAVPGRRATATLRRELCGVARLVERGGDGLRCAVMLRPAAPPHDATLLAAPSLPRHLKDRSRELFAHEGRASRGATIARRSASIVADVEASALWRGHRDDLRRAGVRACWSFPVFDDRRTLAGTMTVYASEAREPSPGERVLIDCATELVRAIVRRRLACSDLSDRRAAERALLTHAERDRARLACDLHDGLGQELTGINLLLGSLQQQLRARPDEAEEQLRRVTTLVSGAISRVRLLAAGSFPLEVGQGGLSLALSSLAKRASEASGVSVEVRAAGRPDRLLPPDLATQLYRIVQEALCNALRHSGARHVCIELSSRSGEFQLQIGDDGRGLRSTRHVREGVGMRSMRYRAALVGGRLRVESGSRPGTRVRVALPLRSPADPPGLPPAES